MQKRMGCKAEGEVQYRSNLVVVRICTSPPTQSDRLLCAPSLDFVKSSIWSKSLRDDDMSILLIVLKQSGNHARKSQ